MRTIGEVNLLDGRRCQIIMPIGENYSRAMKKQQNSELDITIFLMEELCVIDGEKKELLFYKELYCDDYVKIMCAIGEAITPIK